MQTRNNEIIVHRGETWTMRKLIKNKDGSPYIISSRLNNPYWLISIASATYSQANRYVLEMWLNIDDLPRFKLTRPVELKSINPSYTFENTSIPTGYEYDEDTGKLPYANVAIFYEKLSDSVINYKYWEYIDNKDNPYDGRWVDYKCSITVPFTKDITDNWIEQNYYYNISLVDGETLINYLNTVAEQLSIDTTNISNDKNALYSSIFDIEPNLLSEVNIEKPLYREDNVFVILPETKLTVRTNLRR